MGKAALLFVLIVLCLASAGCTAPAPAPAGQTPAGQAAPPVIPQPFVLNDTIRPGDDFFLHVNDAWIRAHPVPADKSSYTTFSLLGDKNDNDLLVLFLNAENATGPAADRNTTLIGNFYRSGMDTEAIGQDGLSPLSDDLARIDAIGSREDLTNVTVLLLEHGPSSARTGPLYSWYAEVNPRKSDEMIPGFWQGGLGLPDRDYYFRTDNGSLAIREAYKKHIATVLILSGESPASAGADAATIYAMEKTLAASHFTNEENRDPQNTTNVMTLAELETTYPHVGFRQLAAIPGSGPVTKADIGQPRFVAELDRQLATAPLADWKAYLRYQLINNNAAYLNRSFEEEDFAFYSTTLNGVTAMKPRWKRVVATESEQLDELVGKAYVDAYVDPRTRAMVSDMFQAIRGTLDARIANLSWMGSATKAKAREKLAAMGQKIAYPDRWRDYAGLTLPGSYAGNVRAAEAFAFIHGPSGLERIGRPVDHSVWYMSPQTVNAYYDPTLNEMVFPAAILQPPFFDPNADPALNYGSLGWVIGHEMTHGFDDSGRQFDKNGNLNDWWTPEDAAAFSNRTGLLVDEYHAFEVLPGLSLNGQLTLGENIADFGGLTLAYHAWKGAYPSAGNGTAEKDREFFYAAARTWQGSYRDDAMRTQVYTDPHANVRYRVNGALFNIPEFYDAFPEIRPGDRLYRNESMRPVIW